MITIRLVLLIVAIVLFVVASLGVGTGRFALVPAGLACWAAATLVG